MTICFMIRAKIIINFPDALNNINSIMSGMSLRANHVKDQVFTTTRYKETDRKC